MTLEGLEQIMLALFPDAPEGRARAGAELVRAYVEGDATSRELVARALRSRSPTERPPAPDDDTPLPPTLPTGPAARPDR